MSTDSRPKVAAVVVIVAGLLVTAAALTKWQFVNADAERRNAETERDVHRLNEELRAREAAQEAELRAQLQALEVERRAERIAPMPREKPALDPVELAEAKRIAHRHCQNLAQAAEAFNLNSANAGGYPRTLKELVMPPFGGPSFLRNGERDLIDPWGKPYQLEPFQRADGTEVPLVLCFGPDNVPISQFGIGDKARPLK